MNLFIKYITMLRDDIKDVMSRRCGLDELNNFIMLVGFVLILIALITKSRIVVFLGALFVVLCYLRVFSKQLDKRKKENEIYMRYMGGVVQIAEQFKLILKMKMKTLQDKEYAYFVCSTCRQIIRVPKGKNKISIRCPKCNATFIKRT